MRTSSQSKGPAYRNIQVFLETLLDSGKLGPGDAIPSDRQLEARFHTSNMPVRRAVQHFVDKGVLYRVHGRGTFVAERAGRRAKALAVLFPHDHGSLWTGTFYTAILQGIQDVVAKADQRMLLESTGAGGDPYAVLCKLEDRVDGFLVLDLLAPMVARLDKYAREKRKPLVLINHPHSSPHFDTVATHDTANARLLVGHLLQRGHRRIACIYEGTPVGPGVEYHPSVALKLAGYRQALQQVGLTPDEALVMELDRSRVDDSARALLASGATACFCAAHHTATTGLLPALRRLGTRVPEDLSLVVYDNTRDTAEAVPPLATLDLDLSLLGRLAARRLLEVIDEPGTTRASTLLRGTVLGRESICDCPGASLPPGAGEPADPAAWPATHEET